MFSLYLPLFRRTLAMTAKWLAVAGVFVILATANSPLFANSHIKGEIVPCDIKLVFGVDDSGMSLVSYDLEMQVSNRQGRAIRGVSIHWLNDQSEIIGNSDAVCGRDDDGIKPAQSGSCRRIVQKIGGRLLDRLGQETWTKIINSEMTNFRAVRHCAIIGYRFGDPAAKSY